MSAQPFSTISAISSIISRSECLIPDDRIAFFVSARVLMLPNPVILGSIEKNKDSPISSATSVNSRIFLKLNFFESWLSFLRLHWISNLMIPFDLNISYSGKVPGFCEIIWECLSYMSSLIPVVSSWKKDRYVCIIFLCPKSLLYYFFSKPTPSGGKQFYFVF